MSLSCWIDVTSLVGPFSTDGHPSSEDKCGERLCQRCAESDAGHQAHKDPCPRFSMSRIPPAYKICRVLFWRQISVVQGKLQAASAHGQTARARHVGWHMLVTGLCSQARWLGGILGLTCSDIKTITVLPQHFLAHPSHCKDMVIVLRFKSTFQYVIFVDYICMYIYINMYVCLISHTHIYIYTYPS